MLARAMTLKITVFAPMPSANENRMVKIAVLAPMPNAGGLTKVFVDRARRFPPFPQVLSVFFLVISKVSAGK